jgi:hypothetical protein
MAGTGLIGQNRCLAVDRGKWGWGMHSPAGGWEGERDFATLNSTNDWIGVLVDEFSLEPTSELLSIDVQDCSVNPSLQVKLGDDFEGQLVAGCYPGTSNLLMDLAAGRGADGNLKTYSAQHHAEVDSADTNGGIGYNYLGITAFSSTLTASRDTGKAQVTITQRCKSRVAVASVQNMTFPTTAPYLFKNSKCTLYDSLTGERFAEGDLSSLTIEINHNTQPGVKKRQHFESPPSGGDGEFSGLVENFLPGKSEIRGTATIKWKEARYDRMQAAHSRVMIEVGFFHPTSERSKFQNDTELAQNDTLLELSKSPTGGKMVQSPATITSPRAWWVAGIEGYAVSSSPLSGQRTEFHKIATSPAPSSPDRSVYWIKGQGIRHSAIGMSPGFAFNKAMSWKLPTCRVTNVQKTGPNNEQLVCNITFICEKNTTATEDYFGFSGEAFQWNVSDFE